MHFLYIIIFLFICLFNLSKLSLAETYPERPIRMIVGLAAGGSSDVVSRLVAINLGKKIGQQIVIDNRPGAGGSVGGEIAARSSADGYTLFFGGNGVIAISPNLLNLNFSIQKDFDPVSMIGSSPFLIMTRMTYPAKNLQDLIALARENPHKLNYGSSGQGSTGHLGWELLKLKAKVSMTHVPFRGSSVALASLLSNEIDTVMFGVSAGIPFIRQKQLRAIATTSINRLSVLPEIQTVSELIPKFEVLTWYGLLVPHGTSQPINDKLYQCLLKVKLESDLSEKFNTIGVTPIMLSPNNFRQYIKDETEKWGQIIKHVPLLMNSI